MCLSYPYRHESQRSVASAQDDVRKNRLQYLLVCCSRRAARQAACGRFTSASELAAYGWRPFGGEFGFRFAKPALDGMRSV